MKILCFDRESLKFRWEYDTEVAQTLALPNIGSFDPGKDNTSPYLTVGFDVEANETYYVFCNGSKLGFFGYVFTPGGSDGISTVKATQAENGAIYNLAGQKVAEGYKGVVIQNGRKVVK